MEVYSDVFDCMIPVCGGMVSECIRVHKECEDRGVSDTFLGRTVMDLLRAGF